MECAKQRGPDARGGRLSKRGGIGWKAYPAGADEKIRKIDALLGFLDECVIVLDVESPRWVRCEM